MDRVEVLNGRIRNKKYEIESLKKCLMTEEDNLLIGFYMQEIESLKRENEEDTYEIACIEASSDLSAEGLF